MDGMIDSPRGWNVGRSRTYKWVRFVVFAALFGLKEYGNRQKYYSLNVSQYLIAVLCLAGLIWFGKPRPLRNAWRRKSFKKPRFTEIMIHQRRELTPGRDVGHFRTEQGDSNARRL